MNRIVVLALMLATALPIPLQADGYVGEEEYVARAAMDERGNNALVIRAVEIPNEVAVGAPLEAVVRFEMPGLSVEPTKACFAWAENRAPGKWQAEKCVKPIWTDKPGNLRVPIGKSSAQGKYTLAVYIEYIAGVELWKSDRFTASVVVR